MNKLLTSESHPLRGAGLRALLSSETTGRTTTKEFLPLRRSLSKLMTSELHPLRGAGLSSLMTSETTNYQLMELAKKLGLHINNIVYVDQLRYIPAKQGNYIINLRNPSHWTGVLITTYKNQMIGLYFNSFSSLMPIPKEVIQFMKRCGCIVYYDSNKAVQLPSTGYCGEFVIDWLLHMNLNRKNNPIDSYESFLKKLNSTDKEVKHYIERHHLGF